MEIPGFYFETKSVPWENLGKLKDDEKIAYTISSLLNVMSDLSKLAKDYDLEGELYHGGGLQRILELMGKYRGRNFLKWITRDNLRNKQKWSKLVEFLEIELKEREAFILCEKEKKSMNLDQKSKDGNPDKDKDKSQKLEQEKYNNEHSKGFVSHSGENCVCHICGKIDNHVSKPCVEYVACKRFVGIKPHERNKPLFKKRLCSKCIRPGVKWNSEHSCNKTYTCNQTYVKNGMELKCEKHVLVCGYHANEKSHKDMLELYNRNVINAHGK